MSWARLQAEIKKSSRYYQITPVYTKKTRKNDTYSGHEQHDKPISRTKNLLFSQICIEF